jgi:hypothetical protein
MTAQWLGGSGGASKTRFMIVSFLALGLSRRAEFVGTCRNQMSPVREYNQSPARKMPSDENTIQ